MSSTKLKTRALCCTDHGSHKQDAAPGASGQTNQSACPDVRSSTVRNAGLSVATKKRCKPEIDQTASKRQKSSHAGEPDRARAAQASTTARWPLQQHVQRRAEVVKPAPARIAPRTAGKAKRRAVKEPAVQLPIAKGCRPVKPHRQVIQAQHVQRADAQSGSHQSSASNSSKDEQDPHAVEDDQEYEVECIVDHSPKHTSSVASSKTFTVKWVGYKETTQGHEFDALVNAPQVLQAYCQKKGLHMPGEKNCDAQQTAAASKRKRLADDECEKGEGANKRQKA